MYNVVKLVASLTLYQNVIDIDVSMGKDSIICHLQSKRERKRIGNGMHTIIAY